MEWSCFTCLPEAGLTPSGLLQLDTKDGEVELIRRGQLELRHSGVDPMAPCPKDCTRGVWQSRATNLVLTVSTHRLVFFDERNRARFLHLSNIHQLELAGGSSITHWNASFKILLSTYTYGDLVVAFRSKNAQKDRDSCHQQIEKALNRRAWENATRLQEKQSNVSSMARRRVGVDHILTKNHMKHKEAARIAEVALSGDAERLLREAGELLSVIHKYTTLLQKSKDTKSDDQDTEKLSGLLRDMGMTSALTKNQVNSGKGGNGEDFHELLARQIADLILPKLRKVGGVISLTDVYCLFNRARGTNLVSPEDLSSACGMLGGKLRLGISKRTFPSGVVVLQLDDIFAGDNQMQKVIGMCPTTPLEASHILGLSPLLALEQLEDAERRGFLCRDVTLETITFYPNKFLSW